MGVTGEYVLTLMCDNDYCKRKDVTKVCGADNVAALSKARTQGWRVSATRACCPACARGEQKGV